MPPTRPRRGAATGVPAETIRGLAAEIAAVAFDEAILLDQPWTDMNGERHAASSGVPVSFHAMRGISAHSNGFQTARALHLLQILIGAVDCPGGFRFEPPYPKPVEAHPRPHGKAEPARRSRSRAASRVPAGAGGPATRGTG
jgi:sulfite dehydrogenase (quinone) subunit SoeA